MRCLARNKVKFWYCPFYGTEKVVDASGNETGEKKVSYGNAVAVYGNVSEATGRVSIEPFGNQLDYSKVIVIEDRDFPIDENSVLFVDKSPEYDSRGNPKFDYIVSRVARSLNSVSYAIRKVNVS